MITLTGQQRRALKRVYNRHISAHKNVYVLGKSNSDYVTYRAFRKTVVQFDSNYIMVKVPSMWLGIELDGYTHS